MHDRSQTHLDVHGQIQAGLLHGLDGPQPAEHGALVVGAAASVQRAIRSLCQHKGVGVPAVRLGCRLHVQVAVHADL